MTRNSRTHRDAFTLLELLVAMFCGLVLATSLYGAMRAAFRARDSVVTVVEASRTAVLSMDLIRRDLESALPPRGQLAAEFIGSVSTSDQGDEADTVSFYGNAPGPEHVTGTGEIKHIELGVVSDVDGKSVLVRRITGNLLSQITLDPDQEVICRNVAGFRLRYFDGTQFYDDWDSTQLNSALPVAVEVSLDLERMEEGQRKILHYKRIVRLPCAVPVYTAGTDSTESDAASSASGSTTP